MKPSQGEHKGCQLILTCCRYWPNGTEVSRYTDKPMVLSGYQIPTGTHVDLNPGVHFRSADIFSDPDEFRPERWLKPEHLQQVHSLIQTFNIAVFKL